MSDLVVQHELMDQLEQDLLDIVAEYEDAEDNSSDMADVVGHVVLGERVQEFSKSWDDRRVNMTKQIKALHSQVKSINEEFAKLDGDLSKALEEEGAKP